MSSLDSQQSANQSRSQFNLLAYSKGLILLNTETNNNAGGVVSGGRQASARAAASRKARGRSGRRGNGGR